MVLHISRIRLIIFIGIVILSFTLWLSIGTFVNHRLEKCPEGKVIVYFNFLAPMRHSSPQDLVIEKIQGGEVFPLRHTWLTASILKVELEERDYPRGQKYRYKFHHAPAMVWPFYVWASGEFQPQVDLRFIGIDNEKSVPSKGPVIMQFNTEIKPGEIINYFKGPQPGKLEPVKQYITRTDYIEDFSKWQYWPNSKLNNTQDYVIEITKGLPAANGGVLKSNVQAKFTTTPEFLVLEISPRSGSESIWLTRNISLVTNQQLKSAHIKVNGLPGISKIDGAKVEFLPTRVMIPGKQYKVQANLVSKSNEALNINYSFSTTNLGNNRWVEIKSGDPAKLWVMEGPKTVRTITLSQKPGPVTPKGTLYEQNRSTTSTRSNPNYHWIWLNADILLHSLPEGMADNHTQLGLPKTYSCYFLKQDDLDWLISYLPQGFMVIIH